MDNSVFDSRQFQPSGQLFHALRVLLFGLSDGLIHGSHQQILDQFAVALADQLVVKPAMEHFQQAVDLNFHHFSAGGPFDALLLQLFVELLHFAADLLRLLQQGHQVA